MTWEQALFDYCQYLKIERGLALNSVENYSRDIRKLVSFLETHEMGHIPENIGSETVQQFIYETAKKINPRSQARSISALKGFFNYLVFENYRPDNPMDLIEPPKIGRKLPDTLSVEEIDRLVKSIDLSKPEGERNRAILETLYGCGLRVSDSSV